VTADSAGDGAVTGPSSGTSEDSAAREQQRHERLMAGIRVRSRRIAILYSIGAVLLIPWTVYLAVTLPKRDLDTHYRGAWVGFDILLVVVIILTAHLAYRMDARVQLPATATATLLVVDAWFDVMTAGNRQSTFEAVLMALCIEIPAALFSLWLARRVNRNAAVLIAHESVLRRNT
jgi:hypothetical protein